MYFDWNRVAGGDSWVDRRTGFVYQGGSSRANNYYPSDMKPVARIINYGHGGTGARGESSYTEILSDRNSLGLPKGAILDSFGSLYVKSGSVGADRANAAAAALGAARPAAEAAMPATPGAPAPTGSSGPAGNAH